MATNASTINRNGVNHSNNDQSQTIATTTTTTSIEDLYKYFGILADAKDQAGKVIIYFYRFFCCCC
jgi:hypothetical protein